MELLQAIAIVVGVVSGTSGLVLGVLNYIHQRDTARPRLRVRPRIMHLIDRDPDIGGDISENNVALMEICNVGHVPVIGSTIGFVAKRKSDVGLLIVSPQPVATDRWPCKIEPGHVVMLRMDVAGIMKAIEGKQVGPAYCRSAIGDVFRASKKEMKEFWKSLDNAKEELSAADHNA